MRDAPSYALGIDIGVTNVKSVRVSPAGEVLSHRSIETLAESPDWPARIQSLVAETEAEHGPAAAVGIAAPGLAAPDGSCIAWMQGRLDAVQVLNWTTFLHRTLPVPVVNDAQAALLGEAWIGAARGSSN